MNMPSDNIAAIDLGSNSFHMIITRFADDQLQTVDRMKEMVQLAAGLDKQRRLSDDAQQRALECLARFGQRLRHIPSNQVRAVGTNTLRQARNSREFTDRAEQALGHPIEIVSGIEEARLIYLGVIQSTANMNGRRLVIDIGGGSTELIIGEDAVPLRLESLYIGCVSLSRRYFNAKRIRQSDQNAAELAVRMELEPVQASYRQLGWSSVTGASGTIKAIRDIVLQEGWSREGINRESLESLRSALRKSAKPEAFAERWGLSPKRAAVLSGGFAVLYGIVKALRLEQIQVSEGALREGVVYDLFGRIHQEDARDRTIATFSQRYSIDKTQAQRVSATAMDFFEQVSSSWELRDERFANDLKWAASLHEIGLAIAHSHYHRHGAYVLEHSDLPGFSRSEQLLLATLVRGHRRKFPLLQFQTLPKKLVLPAQRLCIILRLAVLLHRSHRRQDLPKINIKTSPQDIKLTFPANWLEQHPLSKADLEQEARFLNKAGYNLLIA